MHAFAFAIVMLFFAFAAPAAPVLNAVSPQTGPTAGGLGLLIYGSGLGTSGTVRVGGANCPVQKWSSTAVTCVLPPGQGRNIPIVVTSGGVQSNSIPFNYGAPAIGSLSPASGPTTGAIELAIAGTNFGTAAAVTIEGRACPTTAQTHSMIRCTLPAGEGLQQRVTVTAGGQSSGPALFNYSAPVILNVSPVIGPAEGGVEIAINGTNFGTAPTATVGGQPCTPISRSHTALRCTLPPGQGMASLVVSAGGQPSAPFSFNYAAARPVISSIAPSSAPTQGGGLLVITGSNFGTMPNASVGPTTCSIVTSTDTTISCNLPAGQGANQPVVVRTTAGSSDPTPFNYQPPSITEVETPSGAPTAGGVPIVINGTSFGISATITIGGRNCSTIAGTHTRIQCTLPAGEGLSQQVLVNAAGQIGTSVFNYDPPAVTSVSPTSGPPSGGVPITISGSNFGLTPLVTIGGTTCSPTSVSHTSITCMLPPGEGSNRELIVRSGARASAPLLFSYTAPVIDAISPTTGPTAGGIELTITGSNFGTTAFATVGEVSCVPSTPATATMLRCLLPAGQGIDLPVKVRMPGVESLPARFSYGPPVITNVAPMPGPAAGGVEVTISGSNFGTAPNAMIAGMACSPIAASHTMIRCLLPAGQGNQPLVVTAGGQTSSPFAFQYAAAAPAIANVSPSSGPTGGGIEITLNGQNFGANATATIGGQLCASVPGTQTQTSFRCILPAGQGLNLPVVINAGGQQSAPAFFSYGKPSIALIEPAVGPAAGGTILRLAGTNFGSSAVVTVGPAMCVPSGPQSHTMYACVTPPGTAGPAVITMTVGGQSAQASFTYQ